MVTAGSDGQMKVWDVRTFKAVHEYWNPQPAKTLSISQKGLLAVGWGSQIQVDLFFGGNFWFYFVGLERLACRKAKEAIFEIWYSSK